MIAFPDSDNGLEMIRCEPCESGDSTWCRVWTCRGENVHISELSWSLARRIVPRLLDRYGLGRGDLHGLFTGRCILV